MVIDGESYDTLTSWYYGNYPFSSMFNVYALYTSSGFSKTWDGVKASLSSTTPSGDQGATDAVETNLGAGSGFRDCKIRWNLNGGNTDTNFVRTAGGAAVGTWPFNTQFTATTGPNIGLGIPKDLTQELTLNWQLTWARK